MTDTSVRIRSDVGSTGRVCPVDPPNEAISRSKIDLALESDQYRVSDVWSDDEWTTTDEIHATVEPHGVAFYRVGAR
ncbi:hypothetical protein [Natrialba sp. INN-245]|uniref:hypothetical protein n=1 Tax=Natrialba sp. INN-245 TaxID=2690967 RepID=UPI0013116BCE|nr:hypothetical protein [Natrialba sp. INN-245]